MIIGATGKVGSRLARRLKRNGHEVVGSCRRADQAAALRLEGVEPVECDIVSVGVAEMTSLMSGIDAVVFTAGAAGAGRELTDAIDGEGVLKASAAARAAGVKRFVLVSAFPDAWRSKRMPESFEHYMFVKRQADVHLASTDLDWIILRPGTLLDTDATGVIRLGMAIPYGEVSRDDVASTIVALIEEPRLRRVILELTSGSTPVQQAVSDQARMFRIE